MGKGYPQYTCHKSVQAFRIVRIIDNILVPADGLPDLPVTWAWMQRHMPKVGGYVVIYEDGYTSYSPAEVFEKGYSPRKEKGEALPLTVTMEHLESAIVDEQYLTTGVMTICVLTLKNGFLVTGESACASPEKYNEKLGREYARRAAVQHIWPLEGYLLKQRLHESAV